MSPSLNAPRKLSSPPAAVGTRVDEGNFSLLVHAKAALNRRDAQRALVLLDEHASKMPDSAYAKQRHALRAAAMKALTQTR